MGLSRNKVAVSEGAAGSPPFYGESGTNSREYRISKVVRPRRTSEVRKDAVQFSVTGRKKTDHGGRTPGGVAQMGEHLPCKQGVRGSIPLISTGKKCGERQGEGRRHSNRT